MSLVLNICLISSLIIEQICDSYVFVCKYHSITGEFTPDLGRRYISITGVFTPDL